MNNRYLFLDIDGVLNSERTVFAYKKLVHCGHIKHQLLLGQPTNSFFDPIAVLLLKTAQEQIGFKIVISSTWRHSLNVADFVEMFREYGWDTTDIIIGKTPIDGPIRGSEIKQWLDVHAKWPYKYCIVDDTPDMLDEQFAFFVQTKFTDGLSFEDFKKIFAIFEESYDNCLGFNLKIKDEN